MYFSYNYVYTFIRSSYADVHCEQYLILLHAWVNILR